MLSLVRKLGDSLTRQANRFAGLHQSFPCVVVDVDTVAYHRLSLYVLRLARNEYRRLWVGGR